MRYVLASLLFLPFFTFIACTTSDYTENTTSTYLPSQTISLTQLTAFEEPSANWGLASKVYANRNKENALEVEPGTGILANQPQEDARSNLFTAFEHGDLDLELDFMMPKTSNSGVYLQSRYEVQLFDSWGKDSIRFADCGGIYQRWDNNQGYGGQAPRTNACYAPGLWQHLSIKFEAPRFDAPGKKVRDAIFREVKLNGVVVHENVTVSGPTRAAAFDDEQPLAPLMLQGDHGPVAFRNIRYKRYGAKKVELKNITYEYYEGKFQTPDTLTTLEPQNSGPTDSISYQLSPQPQDYALIFIGTLNTPTSGDYLMTLKTAGASWLWIDDKMVVNYSEGQNLGSPDHGQVQLESGEHSFKLVFNKLGRGWRQGLAWEYEGPEIPTTALQAPGSVPKQQPPPPHVVEAVSEPVLQRGFWWVDEETKKTHTLSVGLPSQVNYVYDLRSGALLAGWGGSFVDATQMWHSRGEDQSLTALGGVIPFQIRPSFAQLTSNQASWPDSVDLESESFRYRGYQLNAERIPVFEYQISGGTLYDQIEQQHAERSLTRKIRADLGQSSSWYCLVAEGSSIEKLPDGSYSVDDHRYYVTVDESANEPIKRQQSGKAQLLLPLIAQNGETTASYTIIW
ncbi:MAG: family 16 glycoside hydrolase [Tunicatimonas sp.]|uniref:family 16 glycoside hydrolase n=1 Tax=Tunicatimonas sp. TaxID=1940096 RepID=UPI003C77DBE9